MVLKNLNLHFITHVITLALNLNCLYDASHLPSHPPLKSQTKIAIRAMFEFWENNLIVKGNLSTIWIPHSIPGNTLKGNIQEHSEVYPGTPIDTGQGWSRWNT